MKSLIIYIALLASCSFALNAQTKADLESQKQKTLQELSQAKKLLEKTQQEKKTSLNRLYVLDRGIKSREKLVNGLEQEIELINSELFEQQTHIHSLDSLITVGKKEYAGIVRAVYVNQTDEDKLMYLLASEGFNQFYQRLKYMRYLNEYRERKVLELEQLKLDLEIAQEELLIAKMEKEGLIGEKQNESRNLISERSRRNTMVRQLSRDERNIRNRIAEKDRIRKSLEDKIRKMIEEEARKRSASTLYTSLTPEQKLVGTNFLQNRGRLPWPVEKGIVTSKYGLINHPVLSGVKISNNGIDISSSKGTKARAVFDGEVSSVFAILGANYAVIIMHGDYMSVYQNLVDLKVKAGDKVMAKQELGRVDDDGEIAVLQFQVWKSKEILNPEKWLSR